ncbi:MAG: HNH endonuclease [Candidatus Omnitrophica bacterium]|nr:HNH endonuclease [Candidatus Omnitrophota bacterium]
MITPKKPCLKCKRVLTTTTYCPECEVKADAFKKENYSKYNTRRGPQHEYDNVWRKLSKRKLRINSLCEECLNMKRYIKAVLVHHIKDVKRYPELRLVWENLMSLCISCHEMKHRRGAA